MSALTQGMGIGFAIAAPVGPIGMLCIRRSMQDGAAIGLATGLGAALADGCYGLMIAGGLAVTGWLTAHALTLNVVGVLVLSWMAFGALRAFLVKSRQAEAQSGSELSVPGATTGQGAASESESAPQRLQTQDRLSALNVSKGSQGWKGLGAFASTFVLTLSNPATIISFVGVVSAFAAGSNADPYWFVVGVFCGSMLWWMLLVGAVCWLGQLLGLRSGLSAYASAGLAASEASMAARLRWIDLLTGLVLLGFAAWIVWQLDLSGANA